MAVAEPFCLGHVEYHPSPTSRGTSAPSGARRLGEVDPVARRVTAETGTTLEYDSLLIAVGARPETAFRHAITFGSEGAPEALAGLLGDLEEGYIRRVAFVVPSRVAGPCRFTSWR